MGWILDRPLMDAGGATPPKGVTGRSFYRYLTGESYTPREYIFASRLHHGNSAFDENTKSSEWDLGRCVRNGRYKLALDGRELSTDGMIELLTGWMTRYPLLSIEDPLAEDDTDGFVSFTRAVGSRIQIVGDDFLVSDADR